jgi:hypothetical protein
MHCFAAFCCELFLVGRTATCQHVSPVSLCAQTIPLVSSNLAGAALCRESCQLPTCGGYTYYYNNHPVVELRRICAMRSNDVSVRNVLSFVSTTTGTQFGGRIRATCQAFTAYEDDAIGFSIGNLLVKDDEGDAISITLDVGNVGNAFTLQHTTSPFTLNVGVLVNAGLDFETLNMYFLEVTTQDSVAANAPRSYVAPNPPSPSPLCPALCSLHAPPPPLPTADGWELIGHHTEPFVHWKFLRQCTARTPTRNTLNHCCCCLGLGAYFFLEARYVIAVQVLNVNEPPTCTVETGLRLVAEKSNASTTLPPAVQCVDPEGVGLSYSIRPGSSPFFGISVTGTLFAVIQVPTIPTEEQNETVLVAVTDGARVVNRSMIVSIQHLNLPAVFINPTALRGVRENSLRGTVISPPANASHLLGVTYSLFSVPRYSVDNSPLFTISSTTGVLTVAGPAPPVSFLDHEATGTYVAAW